jgi:hypothetical protein
MSQADLEKLLALCTLRLDAGDGPRGTAFFTAPRYAITAAHVIRDVEEVRLHGKLGTWEGYVQDIRPRSLEEAGPFAPSPPPDLALLSVDRGPDHSCVLLSETNPGAGTPVLVWGHSRAFDAVAAESELFTISGELETPDPACVLLKLGKGQAVKGMSGAPVLDLHTGEVIGMVRSSRDPETDLGAWVVPSPDIRGVWPDVSNDHDQFHDTDTRWRWLSQGLRREMRAYPVEGAPGGSGGVNVGTVNGPLTLFNGGRFGIVNIGTSRPSESGDTGGGR